MVRLRPIQPYREQGVNNVAAVMNRSVIYDFLDGASLAQISQEWRRPKCEIEAIIRNHLAMHVSKDLFLTAEETQRVISQYKKDSRCAAIK